MGRRETALEFEERPRMYWEDLLGACDSCEFHETWGFFYALPSDPGQRFFEMRDYLLALHAERHPACQGGVSFFGPPEEIED